MKLAPHHTFALVGAAGLSAIALTDAVTHGVTGHYSVFADDSGNTAAIAVAAVLHGIAYLGGALVLHREAGRFLPANRVARFLRPVLMVCMGLFAVGFLVVAPTFLLLGVDSGPAYVVWGGIATVLFMGMLLSALVLSVALVRNRSLGYGSRVLSAVFPVIGATVLLAVVAPDWGHPAYAETTLQFGIALLGVGAPALAQSATRDPIASPTSAV